ncbi:LysR family transcriptional regulator [Sphingobium sp. SA916]|uniref:helix-turn-helix domain-containing protein n=1 Tax=Sphingobium sp. SA916 TaxID=1851207 RepID=UPI00209C1239|nr:LysR family transcriptional regulator [Sphingobium sp. SA916]
MFANRIDIRHLRYFVETVRHGSIRGASQELHLSQPPLTRQIQYLEEVLACPCWCASVMASNPPPPGRPSIRRRSTS